MTVIKADEEDVKLRRIEINKVAMQQILQKYKKFLAMTIKNGKVPENNFIEMKISNNTLVMYGLPVGIVRIEFSEKFKFDETNSHLVTIELKDSSYDEIVIYKVKE